MTDKDKIKATNENPKENLQAGVFLLLLIMGCIYGCSSNDKQAEQEKGPLYEKHIVYTKSTERGNGSDESLDKYGVEGVKKINELLFKAADLMAVNAECDKLNVVHLLPSSTPENIIIYGHCLNGSRFHISEKDINDNKPAETDKQKMQAAVLDLMGYCDEVIKSQLNFPSTYDKSIFEGDIQVYDDRVVIETVFTAKNAFNLEIKHRAKCYFNDKKELTGFEMHEDR